MEQLFSDVYSWFLHNPWFTLVGGLTLIQISPLKLDPWSSLGKIFKNFFFGDTNKRLDIIQEDIENVKQSIETDKVDAARWNILDFANSCRNNRKHTKEEWDHCIQSIYWYRDYCEKNDISNGVMIECEQYLKDTYRHLIEEDNFL